MSAKTLKNSQTLTFTYHLLTAKVEQPNSITAWVDGSQIYGENIRKARQLRDQTSVQDFGRGMSILIPSCCIFII